MTKLEYQSQRRAYRAYLRACARRRQMIDYADSPSTAALIDRHPDPVERPKGYDVPYNVARDFGWRSYDMGRVGRLVRKHQDELGVAPIRISERSIDETKRRQKVRAYCIAIAEQRDRQPGPPPEPMKGLGWTHIHKVIYSTQRAA